MLTYSINCDYPGCRENLRDMAPLNPKYQGHWLVFALRGWTHDGVDRTFCPEHGPEAAREHMAGGARTSVRDQARAVDAAWSDAYVRLGLTSREDRARFLQEVTAEQVRSVCAFDSLAAIAIVRERWEAGKRSTESWERDQTRPNPPKP